MVDPLCLLTHSDIPYHTPYQHTHHTPYQHTLTHTLTYPDTHPDKSLVVPLSLLTYSNIPLWIDIKTHNQPGETDGHNKQSDRKNKDGSPMKGGRPSRPSSARSISSQATSSANTIIAPINQAVSRYADISTTNEMRFIGVPG